MFNYGYSPVPESPWASFGNALGYLGQSALQWMPAIWKNLQLREQMARENLQTWMNDPNLPEDQKRAAIDEYMQGTAHLPAWMRLQWPKQSVPGPVTIAAQPAQQEVAGVAPQPQDINTATGGLQAPEGYKPATAAVPEVRGPATSQWYVPPQPVTNRPVSEVLAGNPILERLPENVRSMRWSDAVKIYQDLGKYAEASLAPSANLGDFISGYRIRQGQEAPAKALVARLNQAVAIGQLSLEQAIRSVDTSPYFISPAADQTRFQTRVTTVQTRIQGLYTHAETLAKIGTPEALAAARQARDMADQELQSANQALAQDAQSAGIQFGGLPIRRPGDEELSAVRTPSMSQEEVRVLETVRRKAAELGSLPAAVAWMQHNDPVGFRLYEKITRVPSTTVNVSTPTSPDTGIPGLLSVRGNPIRTYKDKIGHEHFEEQIAGHWTPVTAAEVQPNPVNVGNAATTRYLGAQATYVKLWAAVEAEVPDQSVRTALLRIVKGEGNQKDLDAVNMAMMTTRLPQNIVAQLIESKKTMDYWQGQMNQPRPGAPSPSPVPTNPPPPAAGPAQPRRQPVPTQPQRPAPQSAKPGAGKQIRMADLQRKAAQERRPVTQLMREAQEQGYVIVP